MVYALTEMDDGTLHWLLWACHKAVVAGDQDMCHETYMVVVDDAVLASIRNPTIVV